MKRPSTAGIIWIVIILIGLWFLRPFWHPILMPIVIEPLTFILSLAIVVMIVQVIRRLSPLKVVKQSPSSYTLAARHPMKAKTVLGYTLLLALIIIGLSLENQWRITNAARKVTFTERAALPDFQPLRLVPKQVASRYAHDSFQSPQERLGDSQIVLVDGKLQRVFPRDPDGALLWFVKKMAGVVTVETDTLDRTVSIKDQEFKYSDGVGVFDNLYYQLNLRRYWVTYSSEPIYLKNTTGEWVTVVPFITYKGFPLPVPTWGGVAVVTSSGDITYLTPEEAANTDYMKGNRLYPKELTEYYTNAYAYKGGLLNNWFLHKDQTEIANLPDDEPIIHASTTEGFKQIVVAEPYGRSEGIYKIFMIDATTGKREIVSFNINSQLTGPVAAADYIKKEFPSYDWNNLTLSEPRPLLIGGELHWLLSVIPNDSAGIAATVVLNAHTNAVQKVTTAAELNALLNSGIKKDSTTPVDKNAAIKEKINQIQTELDSLKALAQ